MSHGPVDNAPSRRTFLGTLGAAAAASACGRAPVEKAIPLLVAQEGLTPGVPAWYATTCGACPAVCSLMVKTRDGRPIKIEGNPDSPLFGSGTCAVGQASLLSLYDRDRLHGPLWMGRATAWDLVDTEVRRRLTAGAAGRIVLLSGSALGPSTRAVIAHWSHRFPRFEHVEYEPVSFSAIRRAHDRCFGRSVVPHYRFDLADLIVSLDADFLGTWISPVAFTRQYAARRAPQATMTRHVHFEAGLSLTGANADVRHAIAPSAIAVVALALLERVRALRTPDAAAPPSVGADDLPIDTAILDELARSLFAHRGTSLVVSGAQDESVQVLTAALNVELDNIERTVRIADAVPRGGDDRQMAALVEDLIQGRVETLIVYGVNPAYDYADPARFVDGLKTAALSIALSDRLDETASHAHAVCPDHHFLEAWGDAQPIASYVSLAQPTISPLFDTRAAQESLLAWIDRPADFRDVVRQQWRQQTLPADRDDDFEQQWDRALQRGFVELTTPPAAAPAFAGDRAVEAAAAQVVTAAHDRRRSAGAGDRFELHLSPSLALRDGRHANNAWLQELPDPITKLTWGHAVAVAPSVARRLQLENGDLVVVSAESHQIELPIRIQPGQTPDALSIALGYGRTHAGRIAHGIGVNAFPFSRPDGHGIRRNALPGVQLVKTGRREALATTQPHNSMEGRPLVREASLTAFLNDPAPGPETELPSLWAGHEAGAHLWGMAIDLNACTGCSACVVACQAENNVPVVGKDEVRRGREMHWIRIDRYHHGPEHAPDTVFQPVMCQHCANAPCETVCPVLATVHSSDGLNQQVYNRCVGTRYCENNCPYQVRRFNWFTYSENPRFDFTMNDPIARMVLNPDVVVRSRGVMEKCSLCVQRIQAGKFAAARADRTVVDGEIQTACQQACPAQAIVFGDVADPESRVSRLRQSGRHYQLLGHLGTRPGVGYLDKIRNRKA